MARYTGPKTRLSRAVGQSLFGYDKSFERRKYAPGQHGPAKRRKQKSEYGTQLLEKQKAKYTYGLLERQFRKTFEDATRRHGVTGEWLLQLLEARLDNVVYRLGLSPSRPGARQLVNHRHICVNGKIVNIPSFQVRPGDRVSVRGRSQNFDVIVGAASRKENRGKFGWLEWNGDKMEGAFLSYPTRDQIPEAINEQLIVELYSK